MTGDRLSRVAFEQTKRDEERFGLNTLPATWEEYRYGIIPEPDRFICKKDGVFEKETGNICPICEAPMEAQ